MTVAPPKQERNIHIASGIDRSGLIGHLNTPSSVIVIGNSVITADRYGHCVIWYRAMDLAARGAFMSISDDTPLSLTIFKEFLYIATITN